MNVAVVGCNPDALIAAHAALARGHDVNVFADGKKTLLLGASYLHERVPGVSPYEPDEYIEIIRQGTDEGYVEKAYGMEAKPWDLEEEGILPVWSLQAVYDSLWLAWVPVIHKRHISRNLIERLTKQYDKVFCGVPAQTLCNQERGCKFLSARTWYTEQAWQGCVDNCIVYNGEVQIPWHRTSRMFGQEWTEWRLERPAHSAMQSLSPIKAKCQCHPLDVIRVGQIAKWDCETGPHHTWNQVSETLTN